MTVSWGRGTALLFTAELAINCEGEPGGGDKLEPSIKKNTSLVLTKPYGSQDLKKSVGLGVWGKNDQTRFNFSERNKKLIKPRSYILSAHLCSNV